MTLSPGEVLTSLAKVWPKSPLPTDLPKLPDQVRMEMNSRKLAKGDIFVAVPGSQRDGRDFIEQALEAGASLVLAQGTHGDVQLEGRVLKLPHLSSRLGELGRALYKVPSDLEVIAVTGTNGKSSVTHYIAALSEALGTPAGLVGTLGVGRPGELSDSGLTTPGPLALQATLGELAQQGVKRVALEASSHALDQYRLDAVNVSVSVFTNLTRDHLDYHGSMAAYAASKAKLFRRSELTLAVVNGDDPLARLMLAGISSRVRVLATGQDEAVTFRVLDWQAFEQGQQAMIATPDGEKMLRLSLMGRFNLDNVLLAMAVLYGLGESLDALFDAATSLTPVPGRMELYGDIGAPSVVVDYAHTPDALKSALQALRAHLGDAGELWCVFGCGGERDTGKRAEMARAAEQLADHVVVTDDNPRNESATQIREQIMSGFSAAAQPIEVADRREAVAAAIQQASAKDVVLIAGKGHEAYQEIQGVRHPYTDSEEIQRAFVQRRSQ
ncbi:UDP-N-acetylmuramoyl-L-alanyl-D-glutamate--2,6-diaminopimelate ligase [Vreelandella neptunia]|uniref:UDP-N-acetylmuramoyl-L-alanyl-D-glutamate--2,6-diaminopimelate ligase n=1 Tax=Vreelandella neptunia TaxID=115551 RepID=A0ABZ0YT16_9GAMM|nr:UDP-N-acetylmuramoyl-L-alanyl-D-glutamate--2,6-diaminopimelate ligase [Halomonas neptunia]MDN3559422.1 UDP-N-acetylmuramoyl-L-alanyl-D-glutamate--2,6-diaminopimelate ligase [Halomonas neptunia]TDV99303.1 UDP-N-acetylmuramoylalanyl-D-glutamate--2,6-diaminopimelate ligase [Halomonas alkaliantarctica]WQH14375.1 UDP-N-acetylmuramoyl-L-alanyl-D-glutamate--2,6-diaminopimelate ligase [Halomonas neptunia]